MIRIPAINLALEQGRKGIDRALWIAAEPFELFQPILVFSNQCVESCMRAAKRFAVGGQNQDIFRNPVFEAL